MNTAKLKETLWGKPKNISVPEVVLHLVFGWFLAVALEILLLPHELRSVTGLDGLAAMSFSRVLFITLLSAAALIVLSRFGDVSFPERIGLLVTFALSACLTLKESFTMPFLTFCAVILAALAIFSARGWDGEALPERDSSKPNWFWIIVTGALAIAFLAFVSAWTVGRYLTFNTPTYDFGIFAQMFHNMKETGLPMTTVERDGLLSHFAVHVSPIYYVLLPFYAIFPDPATLQVLQALVLASAVIPLWLIGKHHGLTAGQRTLLCGVLLLFPALSGGTSYDIHENCFLTPLILWVLYGFDKKSIVITAISVLLTLTVKEDAAMYIAVIALFVLLRTLLRMKGLKSEESKSSIRELCLGGGALVLSLIWFFLATGYLAEKGDGVMTYRYSNFMFDGSDSLMSVVKAVILNPMKAIFECVDEGKLKFIGLTMLPLLGLPLITRRYERFILLIPYLLVNLMSDYQYQHDIMFQYAFGSTACLLYLSAVNLADLKPTRTRAVALLSAVAIGAACFSCVIYPTGDSYIKRAEEKEEYYDGIRAALDVIPEGVPVAATTMYTAYLSDREVLYDVRHSTTEHVLEAEYMALNTTTATYYAKYETDGKKNGFSNFVKLIKENGYELVTKVDGVLEIYRKK